MANANGPDGWRTRRRTLRAFLRAHFETVSASELAALGFGRTCIWRLVHEEGMLVSYCRGVYRSATAPDTLEGTLRAELLRARDPRAALTRQTAAHHLGHLAWAPRKPQLVIPRDSGYRADPVVERYARPGLEEQDVFRPRGLRCLRPYAVVLDLAAAATGDEADIRDLRVFKRVIRAAAKDDRSLVRRWRNALDDGSFVGSRILSDELFPGFERTVDVRSDGEVDLVDLCRAHGLPVPTTNALVHGFLLDGFWSDHGLYAEVDTYETHGDEVSFERDRQRTSTLSGHGLRAFPVTTRRMRVKPTAVAGELRAALAARA